MKNDEELTPELKESMDKVRENMLGALEQSMSPLEFSALSETERNTTAECLVVFFDRLKMFNSEPDLVGGKQRLKAEYTREEANEALKYISQGFDSKILDIVGRFLETMQEKVETDSKDQRGKSMSEKAEKLALLKDSLSTSEFSRLDDLEKELIMSCTTEMLRMGEEGIKKLPSGAIKDRDKRQAVAKSLALGYDSLADKYSPKVCNMADKGVRKFLESLDAHKEKLPVVGKTKPYNTSELNGFLGDLIQLQDSEEKMDLEILGNIKEVLKAATVFKFDQSSVPKPKPETEPDFENIYLPFDPMVLELKVGIVEDSSSVVLVLKTSDTEADLYVSSKITNPEAEGAVFTAKVPLLIKLVYSEGKVGFNFNPEIQILALWKDRTVEELENLQEHFASSLKRVVAIIEHINQPNIEYVDHVISEKLNKKRKKKGKLPLYSYKTLKINNSKKFVKLGGSSGIARAEYRAHSRRGNWHTSKTTGKRWWVRSCRVGDKALGVVEKEYIVE